MGGRRCAGRRPGPPRADAAWGGCAERDSRAGGAGCRTPRPARNGTWHDESTSEGRTGLANGGIFFFADAESKACNPDGGPRATRSEPSTPEQEALTLEEARPGSPLATGTDPDPPERPLSSDAHSDDAGICWRPCGVELLPGWPSAWAATGVPGQRPGSGSSRRLSSRPGRTSGVSCAGAFPPASSQPVNVTASECHSQ